MDKFSGRRDIPEILMKKTLNTNQSNKQSINLHCMKEVPIKCCLSHDPKHGGVHINRFEKTSTTIMKKARSSSLLVKIVDGIDSNE